MRGSYEIVTRLLIQHKLTWSRFNGHSIKPLWPIGLFTFSSEHKTLRVDVSFKC